MTDAIEKAKAALAAVTAARAACAAAGMKPLHPDNIIRGETDALAAVEAHAERWVVFAERCEVPIAIGHSVSMYDVFACRAPPMEFVIESVGRELVHLTCGSNRVSIRLDTGSDSGGRRRLDDADTERIKRHLAPKREKKGRKK